jgi:capsular polysaccharide biosynthesis protein
MELRFESLSFLKWLGKYLRPLLVIQITALILSIIFTSSFFIPKEYKSFTIIYPSNMSDYSHESPSEQMLEFLNSVDIKNAVIDKFDLLNHYELKKNGNPYIEKIYHQFDNNVSVKPTEYGAVELTVSDRSPDTACLMVNYILEVLNKKILTVQRGKAIEVANLLKTQLDLKHHQIDSLSKISKQLSEQYGLLEFDNQTREVTRAYYQAIASGKSQKQVDEIQQQLKNLQEHGIEYREINQHIDLYISSESALGMKYEDAMKDVNRNFTFWNSVSAPYIPDNYSYPPRLLFILGACFAVFLFSILFLRGSEKLKVSRMDSGPAETRDTTADVK